MDNSFFSYFSIVLIAFLVVATTVLSILYLNKTEQAKELDKEEIKLRKELLRLDADAKEIIKTDMELNKKQEKSDRKLSGLESLQKTSRLISTTLDENEIFHRLHQAFMIHIRYEKNLVLLFDKNHRLRNRLCVGIQEDDVKFIINDLEHDHDLIETFQKGYVISSANIQFPRRNRVMEIFNVEHFVICPVLSQDGIIGLIFVGNQSNAEAITDADEEVLAILAGQVGQVIQNARLFEEVYKSQQALESKVQDRTHALEKALNELEQISKKKSEFVSAVSHELRTPLTSIKGYAEILMAGKLGEIPEAAKTRLEKINMHSDSLVQLVNNLLDISRIESGRVEMKYLATDMEKIITDAHDLMIPQLKAKNIEWQTMIDPKLPQIMTDQSQVIRIFINLISNAIKFTPNKGTITVSANFHHEEQCLECAVSDTGIGMNEEDMKKLFSEFYRADNKINQNVKGTGLGLTLAKKIAEAHGGSMWVNSQLNIGTTFYFTLLVDPRHKKQDPLSKA